MKIEIAQHERMSESGSSLLKLIQNQDMPLLDLLVREAVQNSLDATAGKPFVTVDMSVRSFEAKKLNKHLEGITDKLNARFSGKLYDSIVISDSNTVGLTGPVSYDEVKNQVFGNCLKLIYEISKPQTNEGAGGSWGLGKTIYFRIGIGLVLYYSHIYQDGKYKSRLAACFVEDETKKDSIIPSSGGVKRGIAWWGEPVRKKKTTVPIENEREIAKILEIFNVAPYKRDETGTTVIIPYINKTDLLQEVYAKNDEADQKPYWAASVEDYLKVAFQRWYAPRILNSAYGGSYLRPSINNNLIKVSELLPVFKVIRELYISATAGTTPDDSIIADAKPQIDEIRTREVFVHGTSSAGKFAYVKLTDSQLMMLPPENQKSPYQQITNRVIPMENGNTPIIMFTRRPGMIVGYDYNGAWTHRMPRSGPDEFIIGLFIANSANRLADIHDKEGNNLPLEEYIRQGEKADHASWSDRNIAGTNPRVISKIQTGVIRVISTKYKEKPIESVDRKNTGLSHALANILLPGTDFGHRASDGGKGGSGGGAGSGSGKGSGKPAIKVTGSPCFGNGIVVVPFEATVKKGGNILRLSIVTDFKKYVPESWEDEKEIGKPFPVAFTGITISEKKENNKKGAPQKCLLSMKEDSLTEDGFSLCYIPSSRFGTNASVRIVCDKGWKIKGYIEFFTEDPELKVSIDIKGVNQ